MPLALLITRTVRNGRCFRKPQGMGKPRDIAGLFSTNLGFCTFLYVLRGSTFIKRNTAPLIHAAAIVHAGR